MCIFCSGHGAWWYKDCANSNLNGIGFGPDEDTWQYFKGITWNQWEGGHSTSLKKVRMMVRYPTAVLGG